MDNDIEPPSYDHAIQSNEQVFRFGKYKDATYDSFERGEMFIQAFSSQLDTFPKREVQQVKEKGFLSVIRMDDHTQTNELFKHPYSPQPFILTGHTLQFWPQVQQMPIPYDLDVTAQASHPFLCLKDVDSTNQSATHHYFEITVCQVLSNETVIAIGLSTRPYPIFRMPGWNKYSVGYHSDDGHKFCDDATGGQEYGPSWGPGDTIGCGYCPEWGQVYFTKNGLRLDTAFTHLSSHHYFPSVGVDGPATLKVNFGQYPFQYQINSWAGQFM
ncbi:hypothetical protein G6F56_003283 [Rhizopus delemar]|uniref:Protein ssh4 n=1 Tax=Rhizopus stolonifer TaxID=4846 RepID=A0A367IN30_RHIST|nr:hypothetical protein G6F56_003283 [Rhizopus delemar]RCH79075.1 Protein ssh4 [Rhizopus stolonifer]